MHSNPRINDANSIQQSSNAYFLSQVISFETVTGESGISLVSPLPPRTSLHMLTITLEPIKSCLVALPSPKGFGRGLARSSLAP